MTEQSTGVSVGVPTFIEARRSIRAFRDDPVTRDELDTIITAACLAPAPHHSRPWRWVAIDQDRAKTALADGMGRRWRRDLTADGVDDRRIDQLVGASTAKLTAAPALVLGCLTWDGLDRHPDEPRQRAEWGMAVLSLGAAVENLMLAAAAIGLASCWVAAPIFCPDEARDALELAHDWAPQALVLVGRGDEHYVAPTRPAPRLEGLRVFR